MIDESALLKHVCEAIRTQRLPNRPPSRVWGGSGFWMQCVICGSLVTAEQVGYELQFAEGDAPATEYHVHVRCFTAWDQERRRCSGSLEDPPLPADRSKGTISDCEHPDKGESA